MDLSVVIPLYNEEDNVKPLVQAVRSALTGKIAYELILVDDGSNDATAEIAKRELSKSDKVIEFTRNYGQSAAMAAGIDQSVGRLVVTLDGDLQNPPDDIMKMIDYLHEKECDVVAGWRKNRQDGMILRKILVFVPTF